MPEVFDSEVAEVFCDAVDVFTVPPLVGSLFAEDVSEPLCDVVDLADAVVFDLEELVVWLLEVADFVPGTGVDFS